MNEDLSQSPAGESASASVPQDHSVSAAAEAMMKLEQEAPAPSTETAEPEQSQEAQPTEDAAADQGEVETTGETPDGEPAAAGENNDPDDEPIALETLHGNSKIRLRDGTVLTKSEFTRLVGKSRDVERDQQEFATERSKFQRWAAQQAQKADLLQRVMPQALKALEAQLPTIPPLPDAALAGSNVLEYNQQLAAHLSGKAAHDAAIREMGEMRRVAELQSQEQQHRSAEEQTEFLQTQKAALLKAIPDLRDPEKAKAFASEVVDAAKFYGFSEQEASQIGDHRLLKLVRDANAYRKLKASPPKPAPKPAAQASVAQPGRRVSAPEVRAQSREEVVQRARQSGGLSIDEAGSLFLKLSSERN